MVASCGSAQSPTVPPASSPSATATATIAPSPTAAPTPTPVGQRSKADVLDYLRTVGASPNIVVGQHFTQGLDVADPVFGYPGMVKALATQTGRYPFLIGAELFLNAGYSAASIHEVNAYLIRHWQRGGLVTVGTQFPNPWTGGTPWDRTSANLPDLYTPGNSAYDRFHRDLDLVAGGFRELADNGVVVLYRPFHEMNGDWYWWGAAAQSEYSALWREVHDYLTVTKGLSNILWVYAPEEMSFQYAPATRYYPGSSYVDVVGLDWYSDTFPDEAGRGDYDALVALDKPIALTEVGPYYQGANHGGNLDNMRFLTAKKMYPKLSYFVVWNDWAGVTASLIGNRNAKQLMNSPYAVTLPAG
jgi:mannan endo-1,4-beta-mannosidase